MLKSIPIIVFERSDLFHEYETRPGIDIRIKHLKFHGYDGKQGQATSAIIHGIVLFKDNDGSFTVIRDYTGILTYNKLYTEQEIKNELVSLLL